MFDRPGIEPRTPDLRVRCPTDCATRPGLNDDTILYPFCVVLGQAYHGVTGGLLRIFLCCYFCETSCLFYVSFTFDFYVLKIMHL